MNPLTLVRAADKAFGPECPETPAETRKTPKGGDIETISAVEMAKPLPPLPYLVQSLGLASGAPCVIGGYGFSAKTMFVQHMALCVATGKPLFGLYAVKRGSVLHVDYEQGARVTSERYQRLANGMGVQLATLGRTLRLAVMPSVRLDDANATEIFKRALDGVALVVVDSLKAASNIDENDSRIRNCIDALNRAGESHGTVVMLIHHARKPKDGEGEGSRYGIRGSSAVFDACGSVFTFAGERGKPTRVVHQKCRNRGVLVGDFGFRVEDVADGPNPRWGLRLEHLELEQLGPPPGTRARSGL